MRCGIDGEDTDLQVDDCEAVSFCWKSDYICKNMDEIGS